MKRLLIPYCVVAALLAVCQLPAPGQTSGEKAQPDLSEYRTADQAITARVSLAPAAPGLKGAGYLGIHVKNDGKNLTIAEVAATSPAEQAGVKAGDVLVKVDGAAPTTPEALRELLLAKSPGDKLALALRRGGKPVEAAVTLGATSRPMSGAGGGGKGGGKGGPGFGAPLSLWKKDVYRLAVIVVEFADVKASDKITPRDWEEALFSRNAYSYRKNATGQAVHGSLNDYFQEQSYGKFSIEGQVFAPVKVAKKRGEYVEGSGTSNKTAVLSEALTKLEARDGKDALKGVDGLCFIYAGSRVQTNRGAVYYPHQGTLFSQGGRWPYIVCPEGGTTMENISVFAPVFAQLLGLPELTARTEQAGSEGLGVWCLLSNGGGQEGRLVKRAGHDGRPLHLSAWCKEQLGWLRPTVIDPTTRQKLILRPVQVSPQECLKVLVRLDGSEYFLLENRSAQGFDAGLPGQGLLVWRVAGGRPVLEESHGVTGPSGPYVHLGDVPFPSKANSAFTPITTPSSRAVTGSGLPVYLTNIRRLADGRITLFVGYEYH